MRFWLHGNRWMDNYEEARASVRNRKLFNDIMDRKWEYNRYVEVSSNVQAVRPPFVGGEQGWSKGGARGSRGSKVREVVNFRWRETGL